MPFTRINRRALAAGAVTLVAAAGAATALTTPGQAQSTGKTYVITPVGKESLASTTSRPGASARTASASATS